ncbi:MAG: hypothetical protein OXI83_07735, partial [Gemmatimonadota bacterium]|nr:hypothetical protein [Gemmatimonadota bacterium]
MTPEIWTVLGTGFTLAALGSTGFTLLWRYVTRAEQRIEARFNELKTDLKADLDTTIAEQKALGARMHTLEIQMVKLEGSLEGLREAPDRETRCVEVRRQLGEDGYRRVTSHGTGDVLAPPTHGSPAASRLQSRSPRPPRPWRSGASTATRISSRPELGPHREEDAEHDARQRAPADPTHGPTGQHGVDQMGRGAVEAVEPTTNT